MEKPKPVKISMRENPKFFADALARHFTDVALNMPQVETNQESKQKPA